MPVFFNCFHPVLYCTRDISEMQSLKINCFNTVGLGLVNCSKWLRLIHDVSRSCNKHIILQFDIAFIYNIETRPTIFFSCELYN